MFSFINYLSSIKNYHRQTIMETQKQISPKRQFRKIRILWATWDREINRYDLHPIVRGYAYKHIPLTDRIIAHTRIRDYFATIDTHTKPIKISDLAPAIEQYHHTVRANEYTKAYQLLTTKLVPTDF
jgi:hypothetical protein